MDLIELLARGLRPDAVPAQTDVATWWPRYRTRCESLTESGRIEARPILRAIAGGLDADRAGWAFLAGYQSALRAMFSFLSDRTLAAFCVTEAEGNTPRAIRTRLSAADGGGYRLAGEKRWSTLGPCGSVLLVAARTDDGTEERPAIRMVRVDGGAAGVSFEPIADMRFVPEVPHARLALEDVAVGAADVLAGDGYADYVKPFRSLEDVHCSAALLAYLLAEGGRRAWDARWRERAMSTLCTFAALAEAPPSAAATHVALAGALEAMRGLVDEVSALWPADADEAGARWHRDARITGLASQVRAVRRSRAWAQFGGSGGD